jgi:hypothetical protein
MSFGSEQIYSVRWQLTVDPTGAEDYYLLRAPRDLTVISAFAVAEATQNAGTAVVMTLANWGTAGTAVVSGGTIVPALGGTTSGSELTALTPEAGTPDSTQKFVDEGEWIVLQVTEQGSGWIADDRFYYQFDYRLGKG